jgi:hypothetical protein
VRKTIDSTSTDCESAQSHIEGQLREALDTLRADMTRVELWAYALAAFAQPVPGYEADEKFRLGGQHKQASKNG